MNLLPKLIVLLIILICLTFYNFFSKKNIKLNEFFYNSAPVTFTPKDRSELIEAIFNINLNIEDENFLIHIDSNENKTHINDWNLSHINDFSYLFSPITYRYRKISTQKNKLLQFLRSDRINRINFNNWDTSHVKNMKALFKECTYFNSDLSSWNTSNVINMSKMFSECFNFDKNINTKIIIKPNHDSYTAWDTSNVTDMSLMFFNATAFNKPINFWNTTNVTNMGAMFKNAIMFNQDIKYINNVNLDGVNIGEAWNTINVNNMSDMFNYAINFNQDISNWKINNNVNMTSMFKSAEKFDYNILNWNNSLTVSNELFNNQFLGATNFLKKFEVNTNVCPENNYSGPLICWKEKDNGIEPIFTRPAHFNTNNSNILIPDECKHILIEDCNSVEKCREKCKIHDCGKYINDFLMIYDSAKICE